MGPRNKARSASPLKNTPATHRPTLSLGVEITKVWGLHLRSSSRRGTRGDRCRARGAQGAPLGPSLHGPSSSLSSPRGHRSSARPLARGRFCLPLGGVWTVSAHTAQELGQLAGWARGGPGAPSGRPASAEGLDSVRARGCARRGFAAFGEVIHSKTRTTERE